MLASFEIADLDLVRIDTKIIYVCIMYATKDTKGHMKVSLTLKFKVNCRVQVIGFVVFDILDLETVRIDTEILSVPYIV